MRITTEQFQSDSEIAMHDDVAVCAFCENELKPVMQNVGEADNPIYNLEGYKLCTHTIW